MKVKYIFYIELIKGPGDRDSVCLWEDLTKMQVTDKTTSFYKQTLVNIHNLPNTLVENKGMNVVVKRFLNCIEVQFCVICEIERSYEFNVVSE